MRTTVLRIYGFSEKLGLTSKQFLENAVFVIAFFRKLLLWEITLLGKIRIRKYEVQTMVFGIYGFSEKLGLRKETVFRKRGFWKLRFFIKVRS